MCNKKIIIFNFFPIFFTLFFFVSNSYSSYIGTFDGNDNVSYLETIVDCENLSFYGKYDYDENNYEGNNNLNVAVYDSGYSGTWSTGGSINLSYFVVKAGPKFSLFSTDASSGTWEVDDNILNPGGQFPTISHFSGYTCQSSAVPLPATFLLFGTGLLGLAGFNHKKLFKKS